MSELWFHLQPHAQVYTAAAGMSVVLQNPDCKQQQPATNLQFKDGRQRVVLSQAADRQDLSHSTASHLLPGLLMRPLESMMLWSKLLP